MIVFDSNFPNSLGGTTHDSRSRCDCLQSCPQFRPSRLRNPGNLPARFSVPKVSRLLIVRGLS